MPRPRLPVHLVLALGLLLAGAARAAAAGPAPAPGYVGAQACAACHQKAYDAWRDSHHARAMQEATAQTVLGDFQNARLTYGAATSTFFTRAGRFSVNTDGPDGALRDYEIAYTFGVYPLQQYLVELPGGRLQALGIAWDARPRAAGGQRWFHLYPNERVDFRDVLHWTGPAQNWNYMCAECHATNVRKNYDAGAERFATTWSELGVSCEACHGAGAKHVEWAGRAPDERAADSTRGLTCGPSTRGRAWVLDASAPTAHLSAARDPRAGTVCARCHARGTQIAEDDGPNLPLEHTHLLALLTEPLYHADGQILDEVFEYGSFLQSRMHERGVVCTDCHDPHGGRPHVPGNALCARCHQASAYDTPAHHHHAAGTPAAGCVACHMPVRTYMVVHDRHDHSFRVPRPDLSVALGTPNTCTDCHRDRTAQWATDAVVRWYGPTRQRGPAYAGPLAAGRKRDAGAVHLLAKTIEDRSLPAIARATALDQLADRPGAAPGAVERSLQDPDPLVRRAAVTALETWEPQRRWQAGAPLLSDPVRTVRLAAVNALADAAPTVSATDPRRTAFARALGEYRAAQAFNADRAEAWLNLGALDARLGKFGDAEGAYRRAMRMQPAFMPASVNLADLYRQLGRDGDGERVLREALALQPASGDARHALGLLLVRQRRLDEAVVELGAAAEQNPDNPRYAYVYAVALDAVGQPDQARAILERAHARFRGDRDILSALAEFAARSGDGDAAARWTTALRDLDRIEAGQGSDAAPR